MVSMFYRSLSISIFNCNQLLGSGNRHKGFLISRNVQYIEKVKGIGFYNLYPGIQIHITLHHLDLPQILEDEYGGWLSPRIV
jgi:hypothetical protein